MPALSFTLNGRAIEVESRAGASLLETLRERCGITSTKNGCEPQGQCGCCLAVVDGKALVTCAMPAEKAAGKAVVTLEGLAADERERTARAFVAAAGLQCGFCIPGFALRANHLLDKNPEPSRAEIAKAIDVHLCRCTGYTKIIDAVELLARSRREGVQPEMQDDGGVGSRLSRFTGQEMTLGDRDYVADLRRPNMLHGAVRLSEHARAKVLRIDTSAARAVPGVAAVLTAEDVPGERWYGLIHKDWPGFVAVGEEARCVGDFLAAVAAEDEATARRAAALVEVEYEVLDAVTSAEDALSENAPQVNPVHPNALSHTVIHRGDAAAALAASAHVVEHTWHTQRIEHLYLEPEAALAEPLDDGAPGLRLFSQGQGVFDDQRQVAAFLGLGEDRVEVALVPNGGAFGGKEDMSIQAHTALLCHLTGRPVRLVLSREESIRVHPKRHPITMHYRVGCDAEGRLTAVHARMVGDTGAYASVGAKVLERAAGHACGPYRVLNVDVEATAASTNNPPCGAMRGFGANQAHFAMEGALDLLAEKVGIDGWEMRWRNAVDIGDTFTSGQVFEKSVGVRKTLEAVKDAYYQARNDGRAVGIACGIKNTGIGNGAIEWGKARLRPEADGTVSLFNGYTEMGQGLFTVLVQMAAEVTGLPASLFQPKVDSTFALGCGQTTGSRATLFAGNAVVEAAHKLKAALGSGRALSDMVGEVFGSDFKIDDTNAPGQTPRSKSGGEKTHTSFGFATQVVILDESGRVSRVIAAHDVGRAINPALCEGQIEGSVHMGLGYALTEDLPCDNGMPVTFKMREIGVLRARDMPEVEVILVEEHEPEGPFGAKGVGEIGLVPTAGAVAGALAAFDGVRRYELPMKDSPAAQAMSVGRIKPKR
ncbi:selenium-dependent xanthine dehydrogenase [Haliangium ochraceum]|uniref:Selenium-dependent molybdenum hydroxylase 1 n=1 Tax=Haliangium ochraceum (strain DSM 14365 / JCM 11303 / SMP-2) TaxID=502025 RepID=D0LKS5_HALO1|nr:selenium-dependent xanthine dehydrogenase [Haliangium ochraceum]ACY16645.1 selenium-dependent molybdenum hydroxylase 1 [Haliangium ochraceum DSM 14365]